MWAIPIGTSSALKKKNNSGKESQYMFSHPELGSDPQIGLDRELGYDKNSGETISKVGLHCKGYAWVSVLWSFDNSER